ncbi:type IV secretion system lytic transglycosylase VirB1 [Rhizobium bangladeshense]|uniref:type IV secretion system lytic transglycosylase VirB1 n=1 Tax=Rhizobium bangladeshense TaxID=1138189 RepID=UPI001C829A56|nr:type IV secretion system lytic transglycosylase VirB1 [Rhizobium bangladeshense]MBX4899650.1 type IV secretion system lytic transglycosylase VirB1 [Rhizobium bangladeshense]MBX5297568.1 type IV secretion system lytic transglycosylase VirB1 [Rhizobium sp. NLR15a]MBY3617828.1 type IV secretion system lytic transglycosylase VirB1 [Rhizobium bangladeshense]
MIKETLLTCAVLAAILPRAALSEPLSLEAFNTLARTCAPSVSSSTLAAIAKVESGFNPLAIHDNNTGKIISARSGREAVEVIDELLSKGHSIDVGLMQINSANFSNLGLTPLVALDPCSSLRAASIVLEGRYAGGETAEAQQHALRQALSAYNTGDLSRGFQNGYVQKVELASRQVIPSLSGPKDEAEQVDDQERASEESWDVWRSYEHRRYARSKEQDEDDEGSARIRQDEQSILFD